MCTDHVKTTPTLSTTIYIMSILFPCFVSDFVAIFTWITIFGKVHRPHKHYSNIANLIFWIFFHYLPYLEICTDHVNSTPSLSTIVYIVSIFSSFSPDFLAIFALLTIFGNAHRPCEQYPNMSTTVQIMSILFFSFSPPIFWLFLHYLPYLEMCTDHVNSSATSPHHHHFFPDFIHIFSSENAKLAIFDNF